MAIYKLIPSSLTGGYGDITNPSNAYTDTDSTTYAEVTTELYRNRPAYLGGFNLSVPSETKILAITVKVKAKYNGYPSGVTLMSGVDGVELSDTIQIPRFPEDPVFTLTLSASVETIASYADTLCIRFSDPTAGSSNMSIYGAEIIVEVTGHNKIIYGNETLIDLTGDTVTASDVASGKTFHLASGLQATGTFVTSLSKATATTTGSTTRTVKFTGLKKQPSWFMLICAETDSTARTARVQHMLYDGTTTTTYYGRSSTAGSIAKSTTYGSFVYNSSIMEISVTTGPYFGAAGWELYYL